MKRKPNTFASVLGVGRQALWTISIGGRISRGQLRLADIIMRLFLVFVFFIDMAIFSMPILVFLVLLLVLIKTIFLMVQRMNDLDFSANRLLAILGLIIFALIFQNIYTMIFLLIFVIAFQITLYAIPGTVGSNQFGQDPLKEQPKENEKYYILVGSGIFFIIFLGSILTFFLGGLEVFSGAGD